MLISQTSSMLMSRFSRLSCPICSSLVIRMKLRIFPSFILTVSTGDRSYLRTRNSATLMYCTSSYLMTRESPGKRKCSKTMCRSSKTGYLQHDKILLTAAASPMTTNGSPIQNPDGDIPGAAIQKATPATIVSKEHTIGMNTDLDVRYFDSRLMAANLTDSCLYSS